MGIIENVKEAAKLFATWGKRGLYNQIAELTEENSRLREENGKLRQEVEQLAEAKAIDADIVRHGNCYYRKDDLETKKHPYCLACWDHDRKLVGLVLGSKGRGGRSIRCNICNARTERKN